MIGTVFTETLKQSWKHMVYWGIGLAALAALTVMMVPLFDMQSMKKLLENFPPAILALIGVGNDLEIFATNEGFVAVGFFGKSAIIFAVYPVLAGMRITANEEDGGIMDMLLSLPIPRARFVIEKFLAFSVCIVGIVLLIYLGIYLGVAIANVEFDVVRLAETTFYLIPLMVFVMAATMLIGVLVRRRAVALGIITAFVIVSYILQTVGLAGEGSVAESIGAVSFFWYYNTERILSEGFIWPHIGGFLVLSIVMLALSLYRYDRRDIAI